MKKSITANGSLMRKNISAKFLVPIILIVFAAISAVGYKISRDAENEIENSTINQMNTGVGRVLEVLESTNEVLASHVSSSLKVLKERALRLGMPKLGSSVHVNTETAPDLILGGKSQANNFQLVDEVKHLTGASATLFVRNGDDFIRVSTNVIKTDGQRATGTKLDPNGKAIECIRRGESFIGAADILGMPFLTGYEPIFDSQNQVIGVWFVGYQVSTLRFVGEMIKKTKIADNGFLALADNKGKVLFRSDNTPAGVLDDILKNNEYEQWTVKKDKFAPWDYTALAAYPNSDVQTKARAVRLNFIIFGGLLALILTGVIYLLVRYLIIKPVQLISDASVKAAAGDYNVTVSMDKQDELGRLSASFNKMLSSIKNAMTEVQQKKEEAEKAVIEANRAKEAIQAQEQYLHSNTVRILKEMDRFSSGDLAANLKAEREDEVGKLILGFNRAVEKIRHMVIEVQDSIYAAANAGNEISSSTEELAAAAHQQAQQVSEIAGAVEQMARTILQNTENAALSSEKAKAAGMKALEGGNVVKETINGMNTIAEIVAGTASTIEELGRSSSQIGEIIQVIDDIADQTNLLALNAAIEAARAGEQGRGFAVVADEVRKLAERTTKATKEISQMISRIQTDTAGAVDAIRKGKEEVENRKLHARKAGDVLKEIIEHTKEVSAIIEQLAAASEEQSAAGEQISKNIEAINGVTQQSAVGVQEVAHAAEDLSRLTVRLQDLISVFKIETSSELRTRAIA